MKSTTSTFSGRRRCCRRIRFVYRSTLCPELKEQIQQTFLTLDQTVDGKKYLDNVDAEKFER